MAPAVALGPVDELLAVADRPERLRLDVGVEPLLDDRLHLAGLGVGHAHVDAVQVAAEAPEVELVRRVAEPPRLGLLLVAVARERPGGGHLEGLVLEGVGLHRDPLLRVAVEDQQFLLIDVLLARHRVAVGLELRPRRRERVDHPEVRHLALVGSRRRELLRVLRPLRADGRHPRAVLVLRVALLVLLERRLRLVCEPPREAVVLLAVGGQLHFLDLRVAEVLERELVVRLVHHEEVVAAGEEHGLVVGRHLRPAGLLGIGRMVGQERQLARGEVVLEVEGLGGLRRLGVGFAGRAGLLLVLLDVYLLRLVGLPLFDVFSSVFFTSVFFSSLLLLSSSRLLLFCLLLFLLLASCFLSSSPRRSPRPSAPRARSGSPCRSSPTSSSPA